MRHYLNATKICDCLKCNRQANSEEKEETDEEKKKPVVKMTKAEEFEKKLNEIQASFKKQGITDEDELIEELRMQIEEMKNEDKKESKDAKRKRYDVLGYQQMYFDSQCGDDIMKELGSTD